MLPLLVQRELRVALLRRGARGQWILASRLAGAISFIALFFLAVGGSSSSGKALFFWLFGLAAVLVVRRGFGLTVDLFSEERRNGTLGLVILTGISPVEIFVCKLLGAMLLVGYGLIGGLPFFAIPFLAGGLLASQFVYSIVFLANALVFCVAIGLLSSVLHREGGQAHLTAQGLAALLCLATPCLYWLGLVASRTGGLPAEWLVLSPAYPAVLIFAGFGGASMQGFWLASAVTLSYSLIALLLAAIVLHRTWRDHDGALSSPGRHGGWRAWLRHGGALRRSRRKKLLVRNPLCWLAGVDRIPVLVGYGIVAAAAAIWFAGWFELGPLWLSPLEGFTSALLMHHALNFVVAYAAAKPLVEDRLTGGFETLLTTPLATADLLLGQRRGLWLEFRVVGWLALSMDGVFCLAGFAGLERSVMGAVAYLMTWMFMLAYFREMHLEAVTRSMWIAAWTGRTGFAAFKAVGRQWWLLAWLWFFSSCFLRGISQLIPGTLALLGLVMFPLILAFIFPIAITFSRRAFLTEKLVKELRSIACAPIPSRGDKRFRVWSPYLIFPPGPWGELELQQASQPASNRPIH